MATGTNTVALDNKVHNKMIEPNLLALRHFMVLGSVGPD